MDKGTVLLIDDDLDMLLIGQRIFGRAGFKFLSARTGKEGLEKAKTEMPDLILLDYILPDISGRQFLESLAFDEEYMKCRDIPVIILTARSDYIDDLDRFFELGLKAYLNKPFGHRELVNVIDNIIHIDHTEKRRIQVEQPKSEKSRIDDSFSLDTSQRDEINTSARTIAGLCQMFLKTNNRDLSDSQRMDILAISNSCRNLLKLFEKNKSEKRPELVA